MYIFTEQTKQSPSLCHEWHVGMPFPLPFGTDIQGVVEVQADCDELNFVCEHFRDLPIRITRSTMRWFGDDAKFIVANLM